MRAALDTQESILQPPWAGMRLSYKSRAGPCQAHCSAKNGKFALQLISPTG